jgi:hydrogenase assembly chaperone HypC/HupF
MCLSVPGKIISINGDEVLLDYELEKRKGRLLDATDSYEVGDYVILQGGFVVAKIPAAEARAALELYKQSCSLDER